MIELLVVVAIIALLTAIALPQYRMMLARVRRSEGVEILMGLHVAELAYFAQAGAFPKATVQGRFPTAIGYAVTKPKYYFVTPNHPLGWMTSPTVFGTDTHDANGVPLVGYVAFLNGQLDSDIAGDLLCIAYPTHGPENFCGNAQPGRVHVYLDDVSM